jgi:hypothetical protein
MKQQRYNVEQIVAKNRPDRIRKKSRRWSHTCRLKLRPRSIGLHFCTIFSPPSIAVSTVIWDNCFKTAGFHERPSKSTILAAANH